MNYPDDFDNLTFDAVEDLERQPKAIQLAYCLHQLEAQVNNGGCYAFFGNSSGLLVPHTLRALDAIGALKTKKLIQDAILISYPNGLPSDSRLHASALLDLDDVEEKLAAIDTAFWSYPEPLAKLVNDYLLKNLSLIV